MKKYKVEIKETKTFVVDVLTETEDEAKKIALAELEIVKENRTEHYHETGDAEIETIIYNVSDTDDSFNAIN